MDRVADGQQFIMRLLVALRLLDRCVLMQNLQKQSEKLAAEILDIDFNDAVSKRCYYKFGICSQRK